MKGSQSVTSTSNGSGIVTKDSNDGGEDLVKSSIDDKELPLANDEFRRLSIGSDVELSQRSRRSTRTTSLSKGEKER